MSLHQARTLLALQHVTRRFGGLVAVRDVSLDIAHGERRVVLGPNGAGKSTLFNLVAGDLAVSAGSVLLDGRDLTGLPPHARSRLGVARSYQKSTLFAGLTVADNIRLALLGSRGPRRGVRARSARSLDERVQSTAARVGLADLAGAGAHELSHGQQRQLELGIALAAEPRLLLLDEPAAGLSPSERALLSTLLAELPRDLTVVLIEHDMDVALPFADLVTVMHDGSVVDQGTPEQIAASQIVHDIYLGAGHA